MVQLPILSGAMRGRSRFAGLPRIQAFAVVLVLVATIVFSLLTRPDMSMDAASMPEMHKRAAMPGAGVPPRDEDLALYHAITARMSRGEPYYAAAAAEQRAQGYPLKPAFSVRLPTLALLSAALGTTLTLVLLWGLAGATFITWWVRFTGAFNPPQRRISAAMLVVAGCATVTLGQYAVMHELWAGLLMALSLGLHRPERWWPSLAAALCAVLIRELALPFLLLMGATALVEARWREALGWAGGVFAFAFVMSIHVQAVAALAHPGDLTSPGWSNLGGWHSWMRALVLSGPLRVLPDSLAMAGVILALFGWLSWRTRAGTVAATMFAGYGLIFMLIGRAENFYWGMLVTPLLLAGLAFLPQAFADLRQSLQPGIRPAYAA